MRAHFLLMSLVGGLVVGCSAPVAQAPEDGGGGGAEDAGGDGGADAGRPPRVVAFADCGRVALEDGGHTTAPATTADGGDCGALVELPFTVLSEGAELSWPNGSPTCPAVEASCQSVSVVRFDDRAAFDAHPRSAQLEQAVATVDFATHSLLLASACVCPSTNYDLETTAVRQDECGTHLSVRYRQPGNCGGGGALTWPYTLIVIPKAAPAHACGEATVVEAVCG